MNALSIITPVSSARQPLAQAIAMALSITAVGTQAATFEVTTNSDSGSGSLRLAVANANGLAGTDQITFNPGLGTITLSSGQIDITESLTISGPPSGQTISGNNASRIFRVTEPSQRLSLENLTLTQGYSSGGGRGYCEAGAGGGAVCSLSPLTLTNTVVTGNRTVGENASGGGIRVFVAFGNAVNGVTLTNSVVSSNTTTGKNARGGGVYSYYVDTAVINSIISDNSTQGESAGGGGLAVNGGPGATGTTRVINSTLTGNSTLGDLANGGGLDVTSGAATLTNTIVSGNRTAGAYANGGGVNFRAVDFVIVTASLINTMLSGNYTSGDYASGGGLAAREGAVVITDSTVADNRTTGVFLNGGGAGLYVRNATASLTNSTISGNRATGSFAGVGGLNFYNTRATLSNCTVTNNRSTTNAGGIQVRQTISGLFPLELASTILTDNQTLLGVASNLQTYVGSNASNAFVAASFSIFGDPESEVTSTNYLNIFSDFAELATLTDNGCAVPAGDPLSAACVETHALLPTSIALGNGNNVLALINDQRGTGFPRSIGTTDIGAFEGTGPPLPELIFTDGFEGSP